MSQRRGCERLPRRTIMFRPRASVGSQSPEPHLEDGSTYHPLRPTKLDKIKNSHGCDIIATENCGTRGRSIWIQPGKVRRIDKWLFHLDLNPRFEPSQVGLVRLNCELVAGGS